MKEDKAILSIDSVKPGMSTAEVVFNKLGSVILWENVTLDENMITKLKNMGVLTIAVRPEKPKITFVRPESSQEFMVEYERDINSTKQIFQDISSGRTLNAQTAQYIVDSVLDRVDTQRNIIESITQVRAIDEYTYYHSLNVSMLCMLMGKWLRLDDYSVRNLTQAGLLHDLGKTQIPLNILNKPGKLTDAEFDEIRRHSEYGYTLIHQVDGVAPEVALAVLTHHEKEDGSGYPMGLTGDKLNLYSKVITVVDIYDAMTANRSYHRKDTPFKVFELMQHGSFGVLDPVVLKVFLDNITNYYIGTKVRLNTGEMGEVIFMNRMNLSKPVVMVNDRYIDTSVSKIVRIVEFV